VRKVKTKARLFLGAAFFLLHGIAAAQNNELASQSQQAKQLMAEGRFDEAIPIYERLVAAVPGNLGLMLNLGLAEEMSGHPQKAIPHLESVLKVQPDSFPALTSLGMAYLQLNQPAAAIAPLEKLTKVQPENQNARGMLAGAYLAVDQPAKAVDQYQKLTALDASDAKAWYGLGKSYESLATRSFTELSKNAPQSAYVAVLLGDARLQRKQYRSAFFFYREAQNKMPNLAGLHAGLAKVYQGTGHSEWAESEESKEHTAANCVTQSPECRFLKGDFTSLTRTIDASPASLFWATRAYNQLAIDAFDHLGQLPDSVEIHALKAQILQGHGQDAEAAKEWRAALALNPGDPRLETELANSLFQAHKYDELMPLLTKLLTTQKDAPDLNFMMGESLWRTQQPDKAVPYLTAALDKQPEMLPAHAALGEVYVLLNRSSEAVPHLEKAISLDDDGSLHYSLARAYQAIGNNDQAKKAMQESQQIRQKNQQINDEVAKQAEITPPSAL
jgi:tetratricopeptide (TPR) repeat protein